MKNLKELQTEFQKRADQARLKVDCPMDGTFFSDKVIIAEAPGDRETAQKLPLVGGSGSLLWNTLRRMTGLSRKDFYITNVSKRQVLFGETKKGINKHELSLWCELLLWELGHLPNVRYIVILGNYALQALANKSGITNWRGSVLNVSIPDYTRGGTRNVQVLCCNNPAAVIREPKLEVTFRMDMARLKKVLDGTHAPTETTTLLYPSISDIDRFCDYAVRTNDVIAHDIETAAGETACFGFADTSTSAICIAMRTRTENVYSTKEEMYIRRRLQEVYKAPSLRMVAQNGAFDMTWQLYKDKMYIPKLYFDTMLAHHTLYPQLPHNLGFQTTQYTDNPYYKDEKDNWREGSGDIDEYWRYNGKDCCYLHLIYARENAELRDQGLDKFFYNHVMRLQPHLVNMTVGGVLIDIGMKEELNEQLSKQVGDLLQKFQKLCIEVTGEEHYYNPNSPKQMSELYFSKLKLVGRGVSTDSENRGRMFKHPRTSEKARQIIQAHNEYAEEAKFYSTYVKTGIDPDNRYRASWSQIGVASAPGRLSSSATLWESGGNMQNQPDRSHPMFIADPGYGFAYFDRSQVEARYVAWWAKIEKWKEQFERARRDGSYDAHRALASDMFKVPYDQVPAFDRYDATKGHIIPEGKKHGDVTIRYVAKRCRHGLNYRMGPDRLATTAGLTLAEADYAYRVYHRETPELRVWWTELEREIKEKGCLYNGVGRRLIIMERLSPEALESMVAFKPQSTNGDVVCSVIYQSHDHPKWPRRCRVRINEHDALIALGPVDDLPMALSIMKAYAEAPIYINGEELIVPAECKLSFPDEKGIHRWSNLKSVSIENASI